MSIINNQWNKKRKKSSFVFWRTDGSDISFRSGSSEDTHCVTSPGPRTASVVFWLVLCSAPSLRRHEWGNPENTRNERGKKIPERKVKWTVWHHKSNTIRLSVHGMTTTFTVSSKLEYLSVSVRNISHGGIFIFPSLASWNSKRNERGNILRWKETELCEWETSCSCFLLAASSFFSFFSSSTWERRKQLSTTHWHKRHFTAVAVPAPKRLSFSRPRRWACLSARRRARCSGAELGETHTWYEVSIEGCHCNRTDSLESTNSAMFTWYKWFK